MIAQRDRFTKTGWRRTIEQVGGSGKLIGILRVDQVYARYQHQRMDLVHPRGGGPLYLTLPFFSNYADYLQQVADAFLDGDPQNAMADAMEALNTAMADATPILFNNLRRSGRPMVISNGAKVYDRAPWQRRLTKAQLRAQRRGHRGRR